MIATLYVKYIRGDRDVTRGDVFTKMAPMMAKPAVVLVVVVVVAVVGNGDDTDGGGR